MSALSSASAMAAASAASPSTPSARLRRHTWRDLRGYFTMPRSRSTFLCTSTLRSISRWNATLSR